MKTTTTTISLKDSREVTGGTNGYPVPFLGAAVFADTLEELKELSEKFEVHIHDFKWKAGWHNCADGGGVDPDQSRDLNFNELVRLADKHDDGEVIDLKTFDELAWVNEQVEWWSDDGELSAEILEAINNCAKELSKLKDISCDAATVRDLQVNETYSALWSGFGYDSSYCKIGLFLEREEWEINWTNNVATRREEEEEEENGN
jgi:hypothetical protein